MVHGRLEIFFFLSDYMYPTRRCPLTFPLPANDPQHMLRFEERGPLPRTNESSVR